MLQVNVYCRSGWFRSYPAAKGSSGEGFFPDKGPCDASVSKWGDQTHCCKEEGRRQKRERVRERTKYFLLISFALVILSLQILFGNFYRVVILNASIQVFPFASLCVIKNLRHSHLSNRIHQVMSEILQLWQAWQLWLYAVSNSYGPNSYHMAFHPDWQTITWWGCHSNHVISFLAFVQLCCTVNPLITVRPPSGLLHLFRKVPASRAANNCQGPSWSHPFLPGHLVLFHPLPSPRRSRRCHGVKEW